MPVVVVTGARQTGKSTLVRQLAPGDERPVIEWKGRLLPIEVKTASAVRPTDARHLRTFRREDADRSRAALLLYDGDEVFWLTDGVLAAPWWRVI